MDIDMRHPCPCKNNGQFNIVSESESLPDGRKFDHNS